jgi:Smg protein
LGERILEIVFYLVQHMKNNNGAVMHLDDISRSLKNMGFSENEISSAYGWFLEEVQTRGSQSILEESNVSFAPRVFSETEKQVFTTEARGFLVQLYQLGLLNAEQFEAIIDRVHVLEPTIIDVKSLKIIASSIIFDRASRNWDLNWFNISGEETAN